MATSGRWYPSARGSRRCTVMAFTVEMLRTFLLGVVDNVDKYEEERNQILPQFLVSFTQWSLFLFSTVCILVHHCSSILSNCILPGISHVLTVNAERSGFILTENCIS